MRDCNTRTSEIRDERHIEMDDAPVSAVPECAGSRHRTAGGPGRGEMTVSVEHEGLVECDWWASGGERF